MMLIQHHNNFIFSYDDNLKYTCILYRNTENETNEFNETNNESQSY